MKAKLSPYFFVIFSSQKASEVIYLSTHLLSNVTFVKQELWLGNGAI